ncbi:acetyltransferase [Vibrio harveyi]|uniref:GNAT family N-acetyltransferase n=1 Tax=Vibrio harveyi TaxID=669 RepID=UPI00041140F3|nr:N-acetyltransferase [Vibrio harveyi]ELC3157427.1 GNAT family N-acetyltransferase [Vibrio harveyi]ELE7130991.1 GNAT family N-acetyltransferase [Vibrio harveyi]KNY39943.1 acetyltransferase [Vibrio harveyi]RCR64007.1 N-acetyltransferase [Vibrio harveyi]RCR64079.1 N-acetyltransferase [Vibrio harveyi]
MQITSADKNDLAALYTLEHKLFGHHAYPQFFFRQAFDCWSQGLLVAKEEGQIAGYVLMATSDEQNTQWILSLAVDATHRGKGVARLLVDKVLSKVETGSVVKLTVDPDNIPAFKLYSSLGFVVVAEEDNYFGDQEPRLVMQFAR